MVGYCMIVMSAANSVSSYVNGRVQKYTGQLPLFLLGECPRLLKGCHGM